MKKRAKRSAGIFAVCFLMCEAATAYSAREILGDSLFERLQAEGRLEFNVFGPEDSELTALPASPLSEKIKDAWNAAEGVPTLVGENLYLLPKGDENIDEMSTLLRSVSQMKGMQYYSYTKKRRMTLYKDAYCIAGEDDRTRVDDNTEGSADGVVQYCVLNDNSLGKTIYRASYYQSDNEIMMNLVNTSPIYFGPFVGVKAGNMQTNLLVTVCDDAIVVYMNVRANFLKMKLIEKTAKQSLLSRLDAIYDWFVEKTGA